MHKVWVITTTFLILGLVTTPGESQVAPVAPSLSYADTADLALAAPVAAHVGVTRAIRLKGDDAVNVPPGQTRFYVEAQVLSLIRGQQGLPPQVSYLVDLPNDHRGRAPKLPKKSEYLVFASTVPERPGELRLSAPDAQLPWSPALAEQVRSILSEATQADAPPRITGVGKAFHVLGSLPGESETQIFLQTADGRPVSLNVLRRPGERPRWAVALTEIVDDAAAPPAPESLLWYRLACTLPPALPRQSFVESEQSDARVIQADYTLILERLGPCVRNRKSS